MAAEALLLLAVGTGGGLLDSGRDTAAEPSEKSEAHEVDALAVFVVVVGTTTGAEDGGAAGDAVAGTGAGVRTAGVGIATAAAVGRAPAFGVGDGAITVAVVDLSAVLAVITAGCSDASVLPVAPAIGTATAAAVANDADGIVG